MDKETMPQLLRVTEVCARLAMSRSVIYREIEAGNLIAIRRGSSLRISSQELNRYVENLQKVAITK
jgi:excisionase family DNA binding protein